MNRTIESDAPSHVSIAVPIGDDEAVAGTPTTGIAAARILRVDDASSGGRMPTEQRPARDTRAVASASVVSGASPSTTTTTAAVPTTTAPGTTVPDPDVCVLTVSVELGAMSTAGEDALRILDRALTTIELHPARTGTISIRFGGEWPDGAQPLGWTSPDRRTILINPDHPLAANEAVITEIVSHELGHVFLGPSHTHDGSLLDPNLNGQVMLSDADRAALDAITCSELGFP